jgi:hypothetical protein
LLVGLLSEIAAVPLPPRRDRHNPRVVKRKMSNFQLKRLPHAQPLRPTRPLTEAIQLVSALK